MITLPSIRRTRPLRRSQAQQDPWPPPETTHAVGEEDPTTTVPVGEEDAWAYAAPRQMPFGAF
jgi:hypothetical protein